MQIRLAEIAAMVGGQIDGDDSEQISGLAKIEHAAAGDLTFIANSKYAKFARTTQASAILVDIDFPAVEKNLVRTANPYLAFLKLAEHFYRQPSSVEPGVHPTAVIAPDTILASDCAIGAHVVIGKMCRIGAGTVIHPGVVISDGVTIGENCLIYSNVSIREGCRLGNRVILQMGAVIGSDGFGFAFEENRYHKIPQMGIVVLEDDVEVGANTTIDRATLGETRIGRGVKLDNLIQIAHNVEIGDHTAIAAQTGVSGSTKIGQYVRMGGQVGLVGHIEVGDGALVGAQSGITKSIPAKTTVDGTPARDMKTHLRELAALNRLPELIKRVRELERLVSQLEERLHARD